MLRLLPFILVSLIAAACGKLPTVPFSNVQPETANMYHAHFDADVIKSLHWLAGKWESKDAGVVDAIDFEFQEPVSVEVEVTCGSQCLKAHSFVWEAGHLFYGAQRQWAVTWLSDKNIRFEPLEQGKMPMTWSRVHPNEWHLLRRAPSGYETVVLRRSGAETS